MTTSTHVTRFIAIGLALAASGLVLSGCAAPVGSAAGAAGDPSAAAPGASAATGDAACGAISMSDLKALVNVPIGKPYNALGSDPSNFACEYGIGKNAGLTGSAIQTAADDTILIGKYGQLGKSQYQTSTSAVLPASSLISYPGLGDKASYWNEFGRGPQLFSYKGDVECEISMNLADMTEVGAGEGGALQEMSDADAAIVVKREAPICAAILGG